MSAQDDVRAFQARLMEVAAEFQPRLAVAAVIVDVETQDKAAVWSVQDERAAGNLLREGAEAIERRRHVS